MWQRRLNLRHLSRNVPVFSGGCILNTFSHVSCNTSMCVEMPHSACCLCFMP